MPEDTIVDAGVEEESFDASQNESTETDVETPEQSNEPVSDTGEWKTKYEEVLKNNKALNRQVVTLMRQANADKGLYKKQGQANDFGEQPESNDFVAAKERASFHLMKDLGGILDLYPELPAREKQRIMNNPWAFTNDDTYGSLNKANALLEIEEYVSSLVDEIGAEEPEVEQPQPRVSKQVKPNPAPVVTKEDESEEEENLYTMPMEELEKRANRDRKRLMSK